MTYYISRVDDRSHPKFITYNNEVYERHLVDRLSVATWKQNDVPTMTEWTLSKWSETEKGQWINEHGVRLHHLSHDNLSSNEIHIAIYVYITPKRWTEYCLRFLDNSTRRDYNI
jgi:hypothetical protein